MNKTFKLNQAILAHNETINELTLREMTVSDLRRVKTLPYAIKEDGSLTINTEIMAQLISRIANIPNSSVESMAIKDFSFLCYEIVSFLASEASEISMN